MKPAKDATSKVFAYSQKTRCLKLFQRVVEGYEEILEAARSRYGSEAEVRAEINPTTGKGCWWWVRSKTTRGTLPSRMLKSATRPPTSATISPRPCRRSNMSAVQSAFVNRSRKGWVFQPVERFDEQELIDAAAQVYMEIADHNQTMGKNKAC